MAAATIPPRPNETIAMPTERLSDIVPYRTKDGSEIREIVHPTVHGSTRSSLAEAIVQPGDTTALHRHRVTEEIYYVTAGQGEMTLGERRFEVRTGDAVLIPPGTAHCIRASGTHPLHILCVCAPAYSHEDTELLTAGPGPDRAA